MKTTTYDETKWKLVPIKPTPEMMQVGEESYDYEISEGGSTLSGIDYAWSQMLDEAPSAGEAQPGDGRHAVYDTATHEAVERGELERLRRIERAAHGLLVDDFKNATIADPPSFNGTDQPWRVWHLHPAVYNVMRAAQQNLYIALGGNDRHLPPASIDAAQAEKGGDGNA